MQKSASIQPRTSFSELGGNYSILFNCVLTHAFRACLALLRVEQLLREGRRRLRGLDHRLDGLHDLLRPVLPVDLQERGLRAHASDEVVAGAPGLFI